LYRYLSRIILGTTCSIVQSSMCSEKAPRAINWHRAGRLALYSRPRNRVLRNVTRNEPITCLTLERDSALDTRLVGSSAYSERYVFESIYFPHFKKQVGGKKRKNRRERKRKKKESDRSRVNDREGNATDSALRSYF